MPVKSIAQREWLAIHNPELLHKWANEYPGKELKNANLPYHVKSESVAGLTPKPEKVKFSGWEKLK
jgi:hypothetical protein